MLRHLTIQNFAIIESVSVDFSKGMTVLSGETGAGKSIIIDALSLILGARGSSDFIRYGQEKLSIEALFQFDTAYPDLENFLHKQGFESDLMSEDLIIRREIMQNGKNLIRINGNLANVSLLKELGQYLGDIHGQNEHQQLLDNKQHLLLLDIYGDESHQDLKDRYLVAYQAYKEQRKAWLSAKQNDSNLQQRLNFLTFQQEELKALNLNLQEEEELDRQSKLAQNYQRTQGQLQVTVDALSEGPENALLMLDQASEALSGLLDIYPEYAQITERLTSARYEIEDIAHQLTRDLSSESLDIEDIDAIEERLALLASIKRKYGMTVEELIAYQDEMAEEIDQIVHRENYLNRLETSLLSAYKDALALAQALSKSRQTLSEVLTRHVETELADLYMAQSRFKVEFFDEGLDHGLLAEWPGQETPVKLTSHGMDQVEFYIATNVGDRFKPLVKVASGGELSRFMLALKVVFSANVPEKVMVFDEIDTGVSGRVGFAIAQKMYEVAQKHQVLAITHLPAVAAISDSQLFIEKQVSNQTTRTQVSTLAMDQRYEVIAKMMSADVSSEHSIQVVKEMMASLKAN